MESLPDNPILEFHPDTLQSVRKEYNLDQPGRMVEAIRILEEWVKMQPHFKKKEYKKAYLESAIITSKGSIERAKTQFDRVCTYKTLLPEFFNKCNVKDFTEMKKVVNGFFLPKLTADNYRIVLLKFSAHPLYSDAFLDYFRVAAINCEYARLNDYCNGLIFISDMRHINLLEIVTKLNLIDLRNAVSLYMDGYGYRIKGIHIISSSQAVDSLVKILKQVMSAKIGGRIHVHKNIDTLYEHIPQHMLPSDYGGKEKTVQEFQEIWLDILGSGETLNFLEDILKAGTVESLRAKDKFNEDYVGMPGTFRTLVVD